MIAGKKWHYQVVLIVLAVILAACAPDTLDITPTATFTPEPTATPSPTPVPEGFVDPGLVNEAVVGVIIENVPARLPAGAVEWRQDFTRGEEGVETIPRAENGFGQRVFYTEQTGGQMNLTFARFDSPEDAAAHYEFIRGIRQPLETGDLNDTFPQPNIFGAGLYGSVAIFQIEDTFVEVNIELFSSTQGNPLVPLARATINYVESIEAEIQAAEEGGTASEEAEGEASAASDGSAVLDAVLDELPPQILGDAIWTRDFERFEGLQIPDGFDGGNAIRVFYKEQTGGALQMTFAVFDNPDDANTQYERFKGIRQGLREENTEEGFPEPHVFGQGLYGSVAIFQLDGAFIEVLIERAPGTVPNPLPSISRTAIRTLETAQESVSS